MMPTHQVFVCGKTRVDHPYDEELMLSMLQQLQTIAPTGSSKRKEGVDVARDRALQVFDTLKGIGNATTARLEKDMPYGKDAIRRYLRILIREGKVVSWRIGKSVYYSVARPGARRK